MRKPELMASAKPNSHRVFVKKHTPTRTYRNTYIYCRIRKLSRTDNQCFFILMKQVAKVTLRTVREICQPKKSEL